MKIVNEGLIDRRVAELATLARQAAAVDDAHTAAAVLAERARRAGECLFWLEAVRWHLLGQVDADPRDRHALCALGVTVLAISEHVAVSRSRRRWERVDAWERVEEVTP